MPALPLIYAASPLNEGNASYLNYSGSPETTVTQTRALDDFPSTLEAVDTLTVQSDEIQYYNLTDDTIYVDVKITEISTGTLLAGDTAQTGDFFVFDASAVAGNRTNQGPHTFPYVNTAATLAQWNDAQIEIQQRYVKNMGGDTGYIRVLNMPVTGTYSGPLEAQPSVLKHSSNANILMADISSPPGGTTHDSTASLGLTLKHSGYKVAQSYYATRVSSIFGTWIDPNGTNSEAELYGAPDGVDADGYGRVMFGPPELEGIEDPSVHASPSGSVTFKVHDIYCQTSGGTFSYGPAQVGEDYSTTYARDQWTEVSQGFSTRDYTFTVDFTGVPEPHCLQVELYSGSAINTETRMDAVEWVNASPAENIDSWALLRSDGQYWDNAGQAWSATKVDNSATSSNTINITLPANNWASSSSETFTFLPKKGTAEPSYTLNLNATGFVEPLAVQDSTHGHTSDTGGVSENLTLAPQDSTHAHGADQVTAGAVYSFAPLDVAHGHQSDQVTLTEYTSVSVQDSLHPHRSEAVTATGVTQNVLSANKSVHGHASESTSLVEHATVAVNDASHAHSAAGTTVAYSIDAIANDSIHGHVADVVTLSATVPNFTLTVGEALHAHTSDQASYGQPPSQPVITNPADGGSVGGDVVLEATVTDPFGDDVRAEWEVWKDGGAGTILQTFGAPSQDPEPQGLHHDGTYLWYVDSSYNDVYKLDPATGNVVDQYDLVSPGTPGDIAYNPLEDILWTSDYNSTNIYEWDSRSGYRLATLTAEIAMRGLAWDGTHLWGNNTTTDLIYKIDPADGTTVNSYNAPGDVVTGLHHDGTHLWAVDYNGGNAMVYRLDPADCTVVESFATGLDASRGVAYDGTDVWLSIHNYPSHPIHRVESTQEVRVERVPPNETLVGSGTTHSTPWSTRNYSGTHELRAWARDASGNKSSTYDSHTVTLSPASGLLVDDSNHALTSDESVIPGPLTLGAIADQTLDEQEQVEPPGLTLRGTALHPSGGNEYRVDDVYVYSSGNYVLLMAYYGLHIYDISDPANITLSDFYEDTTTSGHGFGGVSEADNRIITGGFSNGLLVYDDSDKSAITFQQSHAIGNSIRFGIFDPDTRIAYVAWYDNQVLNSGALTAFQFNAAYDAVTRLGSFTHPTLGDGSTAPELNGLLEFNDTRDTLYYLSAGTSEFLAIDVSDPSNIALLDSVPNVDWGGDLAHDPASNHVHTARYGLDSYDVSDPANITAVSTDDYAAYAAVARIASPGAANQFVVTNRTGAIPGGGYEVIHLDMSTPTSPQVMRAVGAGNPHLYHAHNIHWNGEVGVAAGAVQDNVAPDGGLAVVTYAVGIAAKATGTETTLSASGLPSGLTLVDNGDGTGYVSGAPGLGTSFDSPYTVTVTATDGVGSQQTEQFLLTVNYAGTGTLVGVDDATHAHTSDHAAALPPGTLNMLGSMHGHMSEQVGLTEHATVTVEDSIHGHTSKQLSGRKVEVYVGGEPRAAILRVRVNGEFKQASAKVYRDGAFV